MEGTRWWDTAELLLRFLRWWYRGLDCSTEPNQIDCLRLALLIVETGTGSQYHTVIAVDLVAVRYTLFVMCIGGIVVAAAASLASTLAGTEIAALSTAGLAQSCSSPARVNFLHLQTRRQMWKAEWSGVAPA